MKRIIITLILVFCMIFSFTSCGNNGNEDIESEGLETSEEYSEGSEKSKANYEINWVEGSEIVTDTDGYKVERSYRLSPWMLTSDNKDMIDCAWNEVGLGYALPQKGDWNLNDIRRVENGGGTEVFYNTDLDDMYYCVGTFHVKNITDGWHFSDEKPFSIGPGLDWVSDGLSAYSGADGIGRMYYSDTPEEWPLKGESSVEMSPSCEMTTDEITVPFVIMMPEKYTPNCPDGEFFERILDGYFFIGYDVDDMKIGIYGKNGEFFEPTHENK